MSAAVLEKQSAAKRWTMPQVGIGMIVHWYEHGTKGLGMTPRSAIVTQNNGRNLGLNVIDAATHNFMLREGVRHLDDPETRDAERAENGAWEHTPEALRLIELEEKVLDLMTKGAK